MLTVRSPFLDTFSAVREALYAYGPEQREDVDWSITKDEQGITLSAALPGIDSDAIELQLEKGVLQIAVERKVVAPKGARTVREESSSWSGTYRYRLPAEVDVEQVSALYKKGIISIALPLKQAAQPKRIVVEKA